MRHFLYLGIIWLLVLLTSCRSWRSHDGQMDKLPPPIEASNEPGQENPLDKQPVPGGWALVTLSPTKKALVPENHPPAPKYVKNKNVGNTDNSQKNSNNQKSKGEGVIGDGNIHQESKKGPVVAGDGNVVVPAPAKQNSNPFVWLWLLVPVAIGIGYFWFWLKRKRDYG